MNPITTQQADLDNAMVPSKKRLKIERCIARIAFTKPQKEETYQFTLEAIKLSPNMNPIATQQADLDNALVLSKKRLKIERCIARIAFTKPQKEETYQVTLEALKLSPCYPAFQITAEVPTIYMHQFWNTIKKIGKTDAYDFKLDKKKCRVDTNVFCTLKFVSKTKDYQKYGALIPDGMINQDIKDSKAYKTYLDYVNVKVPPKKARKFKKTASSKLKTIPASPKEPTQKDTPHKSVSKKKAQTKTNRGKGIELLSDVALLEDAQLKKTLRKSKKKTHKLQASGSSEGADFESDVPYKQTDKTKGTSNSKDENNDFNDEDDDGGNDDDIGNDDNSGNDDDGCNAAQDSEQTDSDNDENPSFTLKDYEEEQDEEYVDTLEKDKSNDEKRRMKKKTVMS
nr:hypothetical protein [Tanacetum cinerariifolium]